MKTNQKYVAPLAEELGHLTPADLIYEEMGIEPNETISAIKDSTWSLEEDRTLCAAVQLHQGTNWKQVSKYFVKRTDTQCYNRWNRVLLPSIKHGPWTKEEDEQLTILVQKYNKNLSWIKIAKKMKNRSAKQCRERYLNHLEKSFKSGPFTDEELNILCEKQSKYGNRWKKITKYLPGRSENSIKNRWYSLQRSKMNSKSKRKVLVITPKKSYIRKSSANVILIPNEFVYQNINITLKFDTLKQLVVPSMNQITTHEEEKEEEQNLKQEESIFKLVYSSNK